MDCKNSKNQRFLGARLSRGLCAAAMTSVLGAGATAQEAMVAGAITQQYFRVSNSDDPRRGAIISPTDIGSDGHNFKYCNGQTEFVDLASLQPAPKCDEQPSGTWSTSADLLQGARVYDSELVEFGRVTRVNSTGQKPMITIDTFNSSSKIEAIQLTLGANNSDVQKSNEGGLSVVIFDETDGLNANDVLIEPALE